MAKHAAAKDIPCQSDRKGLSELERSSCSVCLQPLLPEKAWGPEEVS